MAVARHRKRATRIPNHMEGAVTPVFAWIAKVSQRKAPGAINAMAFIVRPVRPKVGFSSTEFDLAFEYLLPLLFFLDKVIAEHKSDFRHQPRLVLIHSIRPESVAWRVTGYAHKGKIAADEKAAILESGRKGRGPGAATRPIEKVDGVLRQAA